MRLYYDLHIHSCLSPCGDDDMTPNNIVGMAKLCGYDIIALTDHNTCKNCPAIVEVGKNNGLTVVPGMELCTSEEIHVVCLFATVEEALNFSDYVEKNSPPIENKPQIFGNQLIMDEDDNVIGNVNNLLTLASFISIDDVYEVVSSFGGIVYPAHLNRESYSIISVLGEFTNDNEYPAAEFSDLTQLESYKEKFPALKDKEIITSSDAHYLENMRDAQFQIDLPENSAQALIEYFRRKI